MAKLPRPEGHHSITPSFVVPDAAKVIEFLEKAFGGRCVDRYEGPGGAIMHAEIKIGDSHVMLADEMPSMAFLAPQTRGGTTVHLHLYVKDVDDTVQKAVAAGAKLTQPLEDKFYGDRAGTVEDPYGHVWYIATHTEDVSPKEIDRRLAAMAK